MSFILDNLTAVVAGMVVVLILIGVQLRSQSMAVERNVMYATKKHTLEFADLLTRDLANMGAGMPAGSRVDRISTHPAGHTDTLAFWRTDATGAPIHVRYVLQPADTVVSRGEAVPLYQVRRYENGVPGGASDSTLRAFRVELLDAESNAVGADLEATRQVRVSFINMPPIGDPDDYYLRETYWGTTLRPLSMNEESE